MYDLWGMLKKNHMKFFCKLGYGLLNKFCIFMGKFNYELL